MIIIIKIIVYNIILYDRQELIIISLILIYELTYNDRAFICSTDITFILYFLGFKLIIRFMFLFLITNVTFIVYFLFFIN